MSSERRPTSFISARRPAQRRLRWAAVGTLASLFVSGGALAGGSPQVDDLVFEGAVAMLDQELQEVRGGFVLQKGGYEFSFGIERSVSLNDQVQTVTRLQVTGLPGHSTWTLASEGRNLIQNGIQNTTPRSLPEFAQVIQNSLGNQKIAVQTVVNIAVSNLQHYRASGTNEWVRAGLIGSLR